MMQQFTDRARRAMELAEKEAQCLRHEQVGTEHVLLGLLVEDSGVAANVLNNMGVNLAKARAECAKVVRAGAGEAVGGKPPLSPEVKRVILRAVEESHQLGHNYVGTEHLLLGLLSFSDCAAARVLIGLGLLLDKVRGELLDILGVGSLAAQPNQPLGVASFAMPNPEEMRELMEVMKAWHQLPEDLRRRILAIVREV